MGLWLKAVAFIFGAALLVSPCVGAILLIGKVVIDSDLPEWLAVSLATVLALFVVASWLAALAHFGVISGAAS